MKSSDEEEKKVMPISSRRRQRNNRTDTGPSPDDQSPDIATVLDELRRERGLPVDERNPEASGRGLSPSPSGTKNRGPVLAWSRDKTEDHDS